MKFTQRLSLRVRLTLIFLILASVTWLLSSFVAWKQTTDNVDELFDTQLMLFAKRLSTLDLNEINAADRMAQTPNKLKHGHVDDDALTFAIFTHDGRMVLNDGDNGEDIPYSYQREGFADGQLVGEDDPWRFVWMTSPDGKYRIVVGQEWEYREDMALAIVAGQLIPWLVALPIMLIIMMVLLGRELAPLNKLALALRMRDPDSEKPLNATGVPSEVRPLVESLNQLFARTHAMMVRERRFTSDAAHELRSPLTALKVQTEVAQLSDDDPQARKKALLQAKQELIRGVLEKAQAQILSLETPAYFDMIREMLKKYAQPEAGTIRFSKKDLERMPEGFETEIQNIAGEKGGSLALEKDPADLDGGFILIYGGIEENCTIGAMFEAKRDELSDCVHKVMFA